MQWNNTTPLEILTASRYINLFSLFFIYLTTIDRHLRWNNIPGWWLRINSPAVSSFSVRSPQPPHRSFEERELQWSSRRRQCRSVILCARLLLAVHLSGGLCEAVRRGHSVRTQRPCNMLLWRCCLDAPANADLQFCQSAFESSELRPPAVHVVVDRLCIVERRRVWHRPTTPSRWLARGPLSRLASYNHRLSSIL